MDLNRAFDCVIGTCLSGWGVWVGNHWMVIGGGVLLAWRLIQAFILEPNGIFIGENVLLPFGAKFRRKGDRR
jgi:hypothetical protein